MKYLRLNLVNPETETLKEIAAYLKKGKIVVIPTDTIYGLSCLATSPAAIKKISLIKKRPLDKKHPFLVLVSSSSQAEKIAAISGVKNKIWKNWQKDGKPVTAIFPSRGVLAKDLDNELGNLGLRLPVSDFLRKIIKLSGVPLVSTSFNFHGQEVFADMNQAYEFFRSRDLKPDLIVDGGLPLSAKSSVIVDLSGENEVILRN
ncbi:MAG: L-threonylcarbamoyladenylate synthase [Patescibacteria group bacterium]